MAPSAYRHHVLLARVCTATRSPFPRGNGRVDDQHSAPANKLFGMFSLRAATCGWQTHCQTGGSQCFECHPRKGRTGRLASGLPLTGPMAISPYSLLSGTRTGSACTELICWNSLRVAHCCDFFAPTRMYAQSKELAAFLSAEELGSGPLCGKVCKVIT